MLLKIVNGITFWYYFSIVIQSLWSLGQCYMLTDRRRQYRNKNKTVVCWSLADEFA